MNNHEFLELHKSSPNMEVFYIVGSVVGVIRLGDLEVTSVTTDDIHDPDAVLVVYGTWSTYNNRSVTMAGQALVYGIFSTYDSALEECTLRKISKK